MTGPLTPEVRDAAERSVLCWLARWVAPLRALAGERFPIRTTEASQEWAALRAYGVARLGDG